MPLPGSPSPIAPTSGAVHDEPAVDVDRLAISARKLLDLLDELPVAPAHRHALRHDACAVLDQADSVEPDHDRLRISGDALITSLATVDTAATGGIIAELLEHTLRGALGRAT